MGRIKGGPTRGGLGREIRIYDDEALTTLSTLYARGTGGTTQPNPIVPNSGKQVFLTADRAAGDAFVIVTDVAPFHVGDLVPIYDATNTAYKVITIITPATKRLDLDQTLGFAFTVATTKVNNADMEGHLWFYVDDTVDKYGQVKELGSGRLLPPLNFPVRVPLAAIVGLEEGAVVGTQSSMNFIGRDVTVTNNAGASRLDVSIEAITIQSLGNITGAVTIDLALGETIRATLTGNVSITLTNSTADHDYLFEFIQDGTGSRTVTWTTTVKWPGGAAPVATTGAGKKDLFLLHRDTADYLGVATLNF